MGLLYKMFQSLQEFEKNEKEFMGSHAEKDDYGAGEEPKALIELLSHPVGSRLPVTNRKGDVR